MRQLRLHRLTQLRDMPGAVADRAFLRLLYGAHPYGHTPIGSEASLAALHGRRRARVSRAGDSAGGRDADRRRRLRSRARSCGWRPTAFADWSGAGDGDAGRDGDRCRAAPRGSTSCRGRARRSPSCASATWRSRANTPDYHALVAANMMLGGQFVSRINLNLREDKGLTYGARTAFDFRRLPGSVRRCRSACRRRRRRSAIEESLGEIAGDPRTAAGDRRGAGARRRRADARLRAQLRDRRADRAAPRTQLALYDLPDDYFAQFVPRVEAVTTERRDARHGASISIPRG